MKRIELHAVFAGILLGLSLFALAGNKKPQKPLIINNVQFEEYVKDVGAYHQTVYYVLLPKFDAQLYLTISNEAITGHVTSRKWSGVLNGVGYVKRAEFLSMLEKHPYVTDVYERFVFRLDENAYAELLYDGVELRYTLTEKKEPALLKKYRDAKTWAKCFWLMLRLK